MTSVLAKPLFLEALGREERSDMYEEGERAREWLPCGFGGVNLQEEGERVRRGC